MSKRTRREVADVLQRIDVAINDCTMKIKNNEYAVAEKAKLTERVSKNQQTISILNTTMDNMKHILVKAQSLQAKKKKRTMDGVYGAMYATRSLIPEAKDLHLNVEGKSMDILVPMGETMVPLKDIEGGAFRGILSFLMRGVILSNTDHILFMLIDEGLAMLSKETTASTSQYIGVVAQDRQLLLIEQKREIVEDVECTCYFFEKRDGKTIVRKVEK